ncbi:ATP-dependent Clp protease ATP-binding subunit ClpE [Ananas comosus]|uniref:ATP-dependent Clp protease ATP-binding subunit ClpE n=1 Tax=Ananas comosus TaxID=4615 RepID=A0A199VMQ5_ANACO|nr:ATP-dependent Clp protease ATP-binding subunit ClpE [Ananas comosus]
MLDLGDLKWLMECTWPDFAREVVAEIGKLVSRFSGGGGGSGSGGAGFGLFCSMAVPLSRPPAAADASTRIAAMCQLCTAKYELELAKLIEEDRKKCFPEKAEAQQGLPQWLQLAMLGNDRIQAEEKALVWKQRSEELRVKWMEKCFLLHPNFHSALLDSSEKPSYPSLTMAPSFFAPCPPFKPDSTLDKSITPLEIHKTRERSLTRPKSPPGSPVKTELALGPSKPCNFSEKPRAELLKDLSDQQPESKIRAISDTDFFKKLLKGLLEEVTWQPNAASTIAAVITQCKCGGGRRRPLGPKETRGCSFSGPISRKRKMATALSEIMFGTHPITTRFSDSSLEEEEEEDTNRESNTNLWGKTFIDRVMDAIRRNPFSVIMIEDFDRADSLFQLNIKRAMERGRLTDSHGREIGLGSAIIILASNWLPPEEFNGSQDSLIQCEEKILNSSTSNWQLEFSIVDNPAKRREAWLRDSDQALKLRKGLLGLPFDLNLATEAEDEADEGSRNSSDVTVERDFEKGRLAIKCSTKSPASDLMELADASIVFNPIDFDPLKRKVLDCISERFKAKMGDRYTIRVDDDTVDRIVATIWLKKATLEEWTQKVLCPSIENSKNKLDDAQGHKAVVRLSSVRVRVWDPTAQKRGGGQDQIPIAVDTL